MRRTSRTACTIDIRERVAARHLSGPDGQFRVLDRDGRVLDVLEVTRRVRADHRSRPGRSRGRREFAPQGYRVAAELVEDLTGTVRGRVNRIEVTADGSRLVMFLDDGTEVRFGDARDLFDQARPARDGPHAADDRAETAADRRFDQPGHRL